MYYWLFKRSQRNRAALWMWRKWAGVLTVAKHVQRRNWRQAGIWVRWFYRARIL